MNRGLGAKGGLKEDAISLSKAFNCSPGCFIFVAEAARRGIHRGEHTKNTPDYLLIAIAHYGGQRGSCRVAALDHHWASLRRRLRMDPNGSEWIRMVDHFAQFNEQKCSLTTPG